MKVSKTENRFKTGFQQPKTGFPKNSVLTSLYKSWSDLNKKSNLNFKNPIFLFKKNRYFCQPCCGRR